MSAESSSSTEATRLDRWLSGRSSLLIVGVLFAVWLVLGLLSPESMSWLHINPATPTIVEGPVDHLENVILVVCLVSWAVIARRSAGERLRFALAVAMIVQLVLVLGEEIDWGQTLGFRATATHRNLRMYLRHVGILQPWNDAIAPTAYLLFFLLAPLVPLARMRRWLESAAPIRAQPFDGIAVLALPAGRALIRVPLGPGQTFELVQFGGYLVLLLVTARILRATWVRADLPVTAS